MHTSVCWEGPQVGPPCSITVVFSVQVYKFSFNPVKLTNPAYVAVLVNRFSNRCLLLAKKKNGVGLLNVSLQLGVVCSSKAHVVKVWAPGFVGVSGTCKQVGACEGIFGSWEGFPWRALGDPGPSLHAFLLPRCELGGFVLPPAPTMCYCLTVGLKQQGQLITAWKLRNHEVTEAFLSLQVVSGVLLQ